MSSVLFDKPEWPLNIDVAFRSYNGLSNKLDIEGNDPVAIRIPSDLFKYLKDRHPAYELRAIRLYLDKGQQVKGKQTWLFGFEHKQEYYDLWRYTPSTLPQWGYKLK